MLEFVPRLTDAGAEKFVAAIEQQVELKKKVIFILKK